MSKLFYIRTCLLDTMKTVGLLVLVVAVFVDKGMFVS